MPVAILGWQEPIYPQYSPKNLLFGVQLRFLYHTNPLLLNDGCH